MIGCLSGPPGFTCWISFAPVFSLFTAESFSFLYLLFYLNSYVLEDDVLISWGSFVWAKYLWVLTCIWVGVGLAP